MAMETTISVKESTAQLLMHLKQKLEARSIDETIIRIMKKAENIQSSRFGSQAGLKKFTERERGKDREL